MDSFSVITEGIYLRQLLIESYSAAGADIVEINNDVKMSSISMPNLIDQFGKLQYALLYISEREEKDINQYDIKERDLILSKDFHELHVYSLDYNFNKSFELLCCLVDILNELVLRNDLGERILITEDRNRGIYSFNEFYKLWCKEKGFFANSSFQ